MPPKAKAAPAGKSAAKSSWENELVQESYQEPGFSSEVHMILGEDQETSLQVQERLKETITNRQRFSMVTAEQANEFVLDKKNRGQGIYSEILEQCKGVDGADITDVSQLQPGVLAKLVKTLLLRDKEADMVRRNLRPGTADEGSKGGKRKGSAKKGSARKKSAKSPKRTPSAKKKAGKGKGAETPEVEEKKKWSNLKKRGEVEEEEIVVPKYIDDEPENGPDHYVLLIGFEDPCLPALLAEAGIELTSIIQVRSEKGASKPHLFWDDLTTIFRRAEEKERGKLLDCTRWQLTLYDADVEAVNLYDEIAALAYDLKEKYAAYAAFNEKLEVVEIPTASGDEQNRLMGRYMSKTKDVPFIGQSINVLVHAMRESVCNSVESIEAVPTKVGNTALTNAINSALACFDLNEAELDELKDVYTPAKPEKKPAAPIMNQSDEIGMRLATLETPKRLAQIEKEMLLLYPLNLVYGLDNTKERDEAQGFLTDIDHHLWSAGKYSG